MKALIVAYGLVNSNGGDRLQPGLLKFGGKEVIRHTLDNIGNFVDETLIVTNPSDEDNYRNLFHTTPYKVSVVGYKGPSDPTYVYVSGFSVLGQNDDVIAIADDNLFLFSLDGLVKKFHEVDSSVMAVRNIHDIDKKNSLETYNYGKCLFEQETGKVINTSYSWSPSNEISSEFVTLDIYLVHHHFLGDLLQMIREPNVKPDDIIRKSTDNFYAWVASEGQWWDVGKPHLRKQAEVYFTKSQTTK